MPPDELPSQDQAPPRSPVDEPGFALSWDSQDPLAAGILMSHQKSWLADRSDLKLAVKGRRTGLTWTEALDDVLIASAAKGGDNVWYIGDTKEKGREYINTCAGFAKAVARELLSVEEFLFDDIQDDGTSKYISAWRIRFKSGKTIAALSSRPANIRGLQGIVIIDEAAFHPDVNGVIDACNALLIWGGKIRIISTHNGTTNAFNELIKQTEAGRYDYSIHRIPFDDAVAGGLYERVCLIRGDRPTVDGKTKWYRKIRRSYGPRVDAMREELDVIPREGDGVMLPLAWIEACSTREYTLQRWSPPAEDFVDWPEAARRAHMQAWLEGMWRRVEPAVSANRHLSWALGEDFAMRMDRSSIVVGYVDQVLNRHVPLIVEMEKCPYDQQKQALFFIADRLPNFRGGILDANGNGMVLAQEARQKYGPTRITELMPNDAWQREWSVKFQAAFADRSILIPAHLDVRDDLQQLRIIGGIGKIPRDVRTKGTDGGRRHADTAVALLNFYAACEGPPEEYAYTPAIPAAGRSDRDDDFDDNGGRFGSGAW